MKSGDQQISAHDLVAYRCLLKLRLVTFWLSHSGLKENVKRTAEKIEEDVDLCLMEFEEFFDSGSQATFNPLEEAWLLRKLLTQFDRQFCLMVESLYCSSTVGLYKHVNGQMPDSRFKRLLKRLDRQHKIPRPLHWEKEQILRRN